MPNQSPRLHPRFRPPLQLLPQFLNLLAQGAADQTLPWHQKVRRVGQLNMTEHDPAVINVGNGRYWASLKVDAVLISVTESSRSIPLRFRSTSEQVPEQPRPLRRVLHGMREKPPRVIARMSPDLNWEDALQAHPEWFKRDAQGNALKSDEEPRLYQTCMFTSYFTDYIPAILREVNSRYDVDGFFTNGWPPLGQLPVCHCDQCKNLPAAGTPAYWDKLWARCYFVWRRFTTALRKRRIFSFANLGGTRLNPVRI